MADVTKINGYDIKDATARQSITTLQNSTSQMQEEITLIKSDVNDLKEGVNHALDVQYDSSTQSLTFAIKNA